MEMLKPLLAAILDEASFDLEYKETGHKRQAPDHAPRRSVQGSRDRAGRRVPELRCRWPHHHRAENCRHSQGVPAGRSRRPCRQRRGVPAVRGGCVRTLIAVDTHVAGTKSARLFRA